MAGLVPRNVKSDSDHVDQRGPSFCNAPAAQGTSRVHHASTRGSNTVARWPCAALVSGVRGAWRFLPDNEPRVVCLPAQSGIHAV